jgi:Flp pilus assembly pilin Flp
MSLWILTYGKTMLAPLAGHWQALQARLDRLLLADAPVETEEPEGEKKGGLPTWAIILIAVVLILCVLPFCVIAILTLLGPAIGDVFSNITEQL